MQNLTDWSLIVGIKSELLEMADVIQKDGEIDRERIVSKLLSICIRLHQMENAFMD